MKTKNKSTGKEEIQLMKKEISTFPFLKLSRFFKKQFVFELRSWWNDERQFMTCDANLTWLSAYKVKQKAARRPVCLIKSVWLSSACERRKKRLIHDDNRSAIFLNELNYPPEVLKLAVDWWGCVWFHVGELYSCGRLNATLIAILYCV